jgi:aminopeptidase YwaD
VTGIERRATGVVQRTTAGTMCAVTGIEARIRRHLRVLVEQIGARPPGSPANRRATDYLVEALHGTGLRVETHPFAARWWEPGRASIELPGTRIEVPPPPFSRPCDVAGAIRRLSTAAELGCAQPDPGSVLLIDGELTVEPLFPKAFPFLELPDQRARIEQLERLEPLAVVAVVEAQGAYSFLEDPDLCFPYLVVGPAVGDRLVEGARAGVQIGGRLHEGTGVNVAASTERPGPRTVISAHVDSKITTPGAFDNAGGVAVLLALAEAGMAETTPVELVFFNGEDHYAAPGEQAWLAATDLGAVELAINVDGAGIVGRGTTVAPLACPAELERRLEALVGRMPPWTIAGPWYESDHAIFAMRGIPSLAITSEGIHDLLADIAHTDRDTLEMVDPAVLADVAGFIASWIAQAR